MMRFLKTTVCICSQNFRKWPTNYRVWVSAVLLVVFTQAFTKDYGVFCDHVGIKMTPWLLPFLYANPLGKIILFAPLLLIFCDAPFLDDNQPYVIIRSGRKAWSVGQIAYLGVTAALYFIFIFAVSIAVNLRYIEFSAEWGKVLSTLANTNAQHALGLRMVVDSNILYYFTPLQAVWFTFLFSWLTAVFLGLIIYAVNSLIKTRSIGMVAASFFLLLDIVVERSMPETAIWFSPVSWASIKNIDVNGLTKYPPASYVYICFTILITGLSICCFFANKKQEIQITQPL